jgi:hypothetical protein
MLAYHDTGQPGTPEMPAAYDEAGRPVPVAEPAVYDADDQDDAPAGPDYARLISVLTMCAETTEEVGRRTLMLGYMLKSAGAPRTLEDVGRLLGITKQAAAKRLTIFKRILPQIAMEAGIEVDASRMGEVKNL